MRSDAAGLSVKLLPSGGGDRSAHGDCCTRVISGDSCSQAPRGCQWSSTRPLHLVGQDFACGLDRRVVSRVDVASLVLHEARRLVGAGLPGENKECSRDSIKCGNVALRRRGARLAEDDPGFR